MCQCVEMATNLKIDLNLLAEAKELGGFRTKKETVNEALAEFIRHRKQMRILDWAGKVEFHEDYDYKALRNKR